MKKIAKSALYCLFSLTLFSMVFVQTAEAKTDVWNLRFQSMYAQGHVFTKALIEPWIAEVKEKSEGRINIELFAAGAIVKQADVYEAIRDGRVDIGLSGVGNENPHQQLALLPFIAQNPDEGARFIRALYATFPEVQKEYEQVKFFASYCVPEIGFFSTGKLIKSPDDINSERVLVMGSGSMAEVKAWGGTPVQMAPNDYYIGLQRGMGSVAYAQLAMGRTLKLFEIAKKVTVLNVFSSPVNLMMNKDLFNDMPEDLQKILVESAIPFADKAVEITNNIVKNDVKYYEEQGCEVYFPTDAELAQFKALAIDEMTANWKKNLTRLGLKNFDEWDKKVRELYDTTIKNK